MNPHVTSSHQSCENPNHTDISNSCSCHLLLMQSSCPLKIPSGVSGDPPVASEELTNPLASQPPLSSHKQAHGKTSFSPAPAFSLCRLQRRPRPAALSFSACSPCGLHGRLQASRREQNTYEQILRSLPI